MAQLQRQVAHWAAAADRLARLEDGAAAPAWAALETELGVSVRVALSAAVARLRDEGTALRDAARMARTGQNAERLRQRAIRYRRRYLRTETVVDFYADCVNTRTNPEIAALLQATDIISRRAMVALLDQVGRPTPPVLTYLDKGLGASILKAGLRLWDGHTENPAAVIKIVRHNLFRPTSLVHEAGHQVAHITGWIASLSRALMRHLEPRSGRQAELWAGWSSEMAADAFAFVHTGYASVASLHDVLAGEDSIVFRYHPADPHPVGFLRVLLGVEMCRRSFGAGPWDDLAQSWLWNYPIARAPKHLRNDLAEALPLLPEIADLLLDCPMEAFGARALSDLIEPGRVSPQALQALAQRAGPSLYTSTHWVSAEPLRLLAITGFEIATHPERANDILKQQDAWMRRLSGHLLAA